MSDRNNKFVVQVQALQSSQETYLSRSAKLASFVRVVLRKLFFNESSTDFEKLILTKESNDSSIISKFSSVERFELHGSLSIKEIYLSVVRVPHPLRRLVGQIQDIDLKENCKHLNFDNLEEKRLFLKDLEPNLDKLPVIILIHGLGGQTSQFDELLLLLSQCADCFAIDLPGFGLSRISPAVGKTQTKYSKEQLDNMKNSIGKMTGEDFQTDNIVSMLTDIINFDGSLKDRQFVIIGHSMGTHIAIKLNSKLQKDYPNKVKGLVLMSPPDVIKNEVKKITIFSLIGLLRTKLLIMLPFLLSLFRIYDRLGGLYSNSVLRMVDKHSSVYTKTRQIRWNLDTDSHIWLKYAIGFQRVKESELINSLSFFKSEKTNPKVLLLCGESDQVTPVKCVDSIEKIVENSIGSNIHEKSIIHNCGHSVILEKPELVSGIILNFINENIEKKLDPSFVLTLQAIINGDKWGLKNSKKWQSTQNISGILRNPKTGDISKLLAMKTLRNNDLEHSPEFLDEYRKDIIGIIDISATGTSDSYDPKSFKRIKYKKIPSVSKIPPDATLIRKFNDSVNAMFDEYYTAYPNSSKTSTENGPFIVIHCHYGFNRTGYLICSYLIENQNWSVSDALTSFKIARPPGIKHPHFIDSLYVQYSND